MDWSPKDLLWSLKRVHWADLGTAVRRVALAVGGVFCWGLQVKTVTLRVPPLLRKGQAGCPQGTRQLSSAAGEEGMSDASSNNMQSDLYKVELRWHDLLDLEQHFTSTAVRLVQGEDGVNMRFLTGDRWDKDEEKLIGIVTSESFARGWHYAEKWHQ